MSVVLAARAAVQPAAPVSPGPVKPPYPRRSISLLGANGDVIPFAPDGTLGSGIKVLASPGPFGLWLGNYEHTTRRTPGVAGARHEAVTLGLRSVGLTARFDFPVAEMREVTDRVARALDPETGPAGWLVTEADGTARMVTGHYQGGDREDSRARARGTWLIDLLAAEEPCWTDAPGSEPAPLTWAQPAQVDVYPYLPYTLVEDNAIGDPVQITNSGHKETYPDWVVHGPATSALLVNDTTGERLSWAGVLTETQWLTFITRPGQQQVIDSAGVPRFHELDQDPEPDFWALPKGVSTIRTVIGGIGAGTTTTLMPGARRWLVQG